MDFYVQRMKCDPPTHIKYKQLSQMDQIPKCKSQNKYIF